MASATQRHVRTAKTAKPRGEKITFVWKQAGLRVGHCFVQMGPDALRTALCNGAAYRSHWRDATGSAKCLRCRRAVGR